MARPCTGGEVVLEASPFMPGGGGKLHPEDPERLGGDALEGWGVETTGGVYCGCIGGERALVGLLAGAGAEGKLHEDMACLSAGRGVFFGGGAKEAIARSCCASILFPDSRSVAFFAGASGGGSGAGRGDGGLSHASPRFAATSNRLKVLWCSARETRGDELDDLVPVEDERDD